MRRQKIHKILNNRILILIIAILTEAILPSTMAQSVTQMVRNQTQYLDACTLGYGTIVDDGGITGNYSNNFYGYVVINATPGIAITLTGSYETESGYDYITVYDGNSTYDPILANQVSGSGSFLLTATSGSMLIYFRSDGNVVRSGFNLKWSIDGGALSVENTSANSATLTWSPVALATTYNVYCDGDAVGTTTATTYNLTGLSSSMMHEAEVFANNRCDGGRIKFRTLCGTLTIPFTEDFDDQNIGQIPPCWVRLMTYDDQNTRPQVTGLSDGNRYLQLGCGAGNTMGHYSIVLAPSSGGQTVWPLRMMIRASHSGTYMIIGACDTTSSEYDSYGFVPIDTVLIASSTQWMLYDSILAVPVGKCRLAFKMERGMQNSNGRLVYIDNLNLTECGINELTAGHIDTSSAVVTWSTFGAPDVTVTVSVVGETTPAQTIPHATSPLTLSGLSPDTRYVVTLTPNCGITQGLRESTSLVTQASTDYVDAVCETFSGSYYSLGSNSQYILSPVRNLAGKDIQFRYRHYSNHRLIVGLMDYADDPSSFTPLDTVTTSEDMTWRWAKVTVPNDATQSIVAFRALSSMYIDVILVDSNLAKILNHNIYDYMVTSTSVHIGFPQHCNTTTIAYAPYNSFDLSTATRINITGYSGHTIEGLTPGTSYGFMIFCSDGTEPCSNSPDEFSTALIDADFPFCEDFESEVVGSHTWQRIIGSVGRSTEHAHNGVYSLSMHSSGTTNNYSTLVALPRIEELDPNSYINFHALSYAPNSAIITGRLLTYGSEQFIVWDTIDIIGDGQWHRYTAPVTTGGFWVGLQYILTGNASSSQYVWIDDVHISRNDYSNFILSGLTDTSVTVNYTPLGGTTALQVTLIGGGDTIVATGTAPSFVIDSLVPDTRYDCYVQPIGSDTSCEEYTMQMITPADTNCARVTFNAEGNSIICHTHANYADYMLTVTGNGDSTSYHVTDTIFTIDGLLPSTDYTLHYCCTYMDNGCMNDTTVTTGAVPVPYCIESSDINYTIPTGWTILAPTTSCNTHPYSSYVYMYNSTSHWMYLLLPQLDSTEHLMLTGSINAGCRVIEIGVLTNGNDTSSFVAAATYGDVGSSVYLSGEINPRVDLSHLPRGRVAIRFIDNSLNVGSLSLYDMPLAHISLYKYNYLTTWTEDSTADYWLRINSYNGGVRHITISPTQIYLPYIFSYNWETSYSISQWSHSYGNDCGNHYWSYNRTYLQQVPFCLNMNNMIDANRPILYRNGSYPTYTTYDNASRLTYGSNGLQHAILQDMNIDSLRRLKMSFIHYATTSQPLVVGVMTDAFDTSTFTPIDTIAPNYYGSDWDTAYVDFSSYTGNGRWIALRYMGHTSYYSYFYIDNIKVNTCLSAMKATATLERYNTVIIDVPGDTTPDLPFYVEYGGPGFNTGTGTYVLVDTLPFRLTLPQDSLINIYYHCGRYDNTDQCSSPQIIKTRSLPLDVPSCIDFDDCTTGTPPPGWVDLGQASSISESMAHSGAKSLSVGEMLCTPDINIDTLNKIAISLWLRTTHSRDRLIVGTITNPDDPTSFVPLRTLAPSYSGVWEHIYVALNSAPDNAHFIALRAVAPNAEPGEQSVFIDDLMVSSCAAFGMQVLDANNTGIIIDWEQVGTPVLTITVSENGHFHSTYTNHNHPLTISPVNPMNSYRIVINSTCGTELGSCVINYADSATVIAPGEGAGCVDATNLESDQSYFFTGTYGNPYSTQGVVNYGTMHPDSRHTVCRDTSLRDPRTENQLRTVPEGATASLRLGNWSTNDIQPEAEGVVYSLGVDTTNYSLLLLRYAAVLQNPMHASQDQPRFRLELLDSTYNVIDSACAFVDFIADRNLGWHEAPDYVLWKDWTAIGIDMSSYHGQHIYVRLTTFDCNEGSHYGYAYFTLDCMKKMITAETCGMVDSNRFTAPSGFNYRWYTSTDTTTISTERIIMVPTADMATYYCNLTSAGNSSCGFTLEAYGGPRQPYAACDTTVSISNCHFDVTFTNNSVITSDGVNPIPTNEQVESFYWDFGNGEVSTNRNGHTVYNTPGTYTVTLVASIGGGQCTDTLVWPLTLASPILPQLHGPDTLCHGTADTLILFDARPQDTTNWTSANGLWYMSLNSVTYSPSVNNYTLTAIDSFGCSHTVSHTLQVNSTFTHMDTVVLCTPLLPYSYADTIFLEGTTTARYDQPGLTAEGCDSSYHLWLSVNDTNSSTHRDSLITSICDNDQLSFFGTDYSAAGEYINVHVDNTGFCDSIHTLILSLRPTSTADTMANECDNFVWYGVNYSVDTAVDRNTLNYVNCDSVTTLHLQIRHSTDTSFTHYVIENNLPYVWNGISFGTDTTGYKLTINNNVDCDSTITFSLTVYRNQDTTVDSTVCEGLLPLLWNDVPFYLAEVDYTTNTITHQTTIPTIHGADSLITMRLHILYNSTDTISDTIRQNDLPSFTPPLPVTVSYTQNENDPALVTIIDSTVIIPNAVGCDSLVYYTLYLYRNYNTYDSVTVCDNQLPVAYLDTTFSLDSTDTLPLSNTVRRVFTITRQSVFGTDSAISVTVTVHPTYEVSDTIVVCPYESYIYDGVDYGGPVDFDAIFPSINKCDSLVHVSLQARDSLFRLAPLMSFDSNIWYPADTTLIGCDPQNFWLDDTSTSVSREWAFWSAASASDTTFDTLNIFDTVLPIGIYSFRIIAVGAEGCVDTLQRDSAIHIFKRPKSDFIFEPDIVPFHDPKLTLKPQAEPADSLTYRWLIALDNQGGQYDTVEHDEGVNGLWHYTWEPLTDSGHYDVALVAYWTRTVTIDTLTFTGYCTDTAHHPVPIVNTFLQFPSLVTPNGDGTNDTWEVVNLIEMGQYPNNEVWIYNQWGALVFHAKNIDSHEQCWDPNATNSPDGTYFFRFSGKGRYGVIKQNGVIEVLR